MARLAGALATRRITCSTRLACVRADGLLAARRAAWRSPCVLSAAPGRLGAGEPLGDFEAHGDVGSPKIAGSADLQRRRRRSTRSRRPASNMWAQARRIPIRVEAAEGRLHPAGAASSSSGKGIDPHRKAGVIVRTQPRRRLALRRRRRPRRRPDVAAVPADEGRGSPRRSRSEAEGRRRHAARAAGQHASPCRSRGSASRFTTSRSPELALGEEVYVGLFLCSHNPDVVEKAIFRDVRVIRPGEGRLRAVPRLHRQPCSRSWTSRAGIARSCTASASPSRRRTGRRDGKALIYNTSGRGGGARAAVPVRPRHAPGDARSTPASRSATTTTTCCRSTARMLGISDQSQDERPARPSTRCRRGRRAEAASRRSRRPTSTAGRPTASTLVYTGGRDGEFDIYRDRLGRQRRGDEPHDSHGPRRRAGVHARRQVHLLQLGAQRARCRSGA